MSSELLSPLSEIPAGIHSARDYEYLARRFIAGPDLAYIDGGSAEGVTLAANLKAFQRWAVCPRLLGDVRHGTSRGSMAGVDRPTPILLAPVAYQTLAHPLGELETARGAAAMGVPMVVSTLSSHPLEAISGAAKGEKWFQLYFLARREDTLALVGRAEQAGYSALMVTLDATIQVPSHSALRAGFRLPAHCQPANLAGQTPVPAPSTTPGQSRVFRGLMATAPTWADLAWLQEHTRLPVWVKGVLHEEDATRLQAAGVTGLVVSNHGGRTLDHAPASLGRLPGIRQAVGERFPLLLDSGLRSGTDIYKALALGADAVLVGRLQVYALAVAGALGVAHMLRLLQEELEVCMAMTGCASVADIRSNASRNMIKSDL